MPFTPSILIATAALTLACAVPANQAAPQTSRKESQNMTTKVNPQEQIAQLTIDIPALQQYLHPEASGRKPLKVLLTASASKDWKLNKFDAPVQYVDKGDPKKTPLIEFVTMQINGDSAEATLRYAIEGIQVKAKFSKGASGAWQLASHSLVEH